MKRLIIQLFLGVLLSSLSVTSFAQSPTDSLPGDPGISIYTVQNMKFGAFYQANTGGTITISNSGARSVTGSVVALGLGINYYQALFDLEAPVGTIVSIMNGPDVTLSGSNGGTMSLHLGNSYPASPFNTLVQPPGRTSVSIGGTLTVGSPAVSKPGAYTANFYITFNQE